jgi:hypothetical protein
MYLCGISNKFILLESDHVEDREGSSKIVMDLTEIVHDVMISS